MTINEVQNNSVLMLKDILKVANKNGIPIYPAYGTLLGIVRHKGRFIPWDDDIDIMINSKDIKKLFKAFEKELPKDYGTSTAWSPGSVSTSSIVYRSFEGKTLAVDFFEVINLKDNVKSVRPIFLSIAKRYVRFSKNGGLQRFARTLLSIRSKAYYQKKMEKILNKSKSNDVTRRAISIIDDNRDWFDYFEYVDVEPCKFEGLDWVKPKNPENYLRTFYGEWNKKPSDKEIKKAQHYDF